MTKTLRQLVTFRRCDNCGTINPTRLNGNDRLCGMDTCVRDNGQRTAGKVGWWRLRFPISIRWRGWWTL